MSFGTVLQRLRREKHLTQEELGKAIGVSRSTVGMYEQGKREPDFETEEKIADFFNVTLNYLRDDVIPGKRPYYLDPETAQIAQEIHDDPELRMLLDASRGLPKRDIQMVTDMARRMKETNPDG